MAVGPAASCSAVPGRVARSGSTAWVAAEVQSSAYSSAASAPIRSPPIRSKAAAARS
jgi:hypothetical protein